MNLNKLYHMLGFSLGALALASLSSCSDDHFDIREGSASAGNTIWKNIESTPQLSSLTKILPRLRVYSDEYDHKRTMSYKDLLNSNQSFTFWAPVDGSYDSQSILSQLDQIDSYRNAGDSVSAAKLEYSVGQQFVQNHMARFNYESVSDKSDIRLFNGKITTIDPANNTFNGVELSADTPDLPSSNGMLHLLQGKSPFSYNVYDFMESHPSLFSSVYGILSDPSIDKRVFSESASTPGAMNSQGQMVYVDSVFTEQNELLDQSAATIRNEDSMFVALIPTDAAWNEAYAKVKKLFNYAPTYKYGYNGNAMTFPSTYRMDDLTGSGVTLADSLADYNAKKTLLTSMYFSTSIFRERFTRDQTEEIVNYVRTADSLITTNGVVYYNPSFLEGKSGGENPSFAGEYQKASNGIIFPLSSYTVSPEQSLMSNTRGSINLTYTSNIGDVTGSQDDANNGAITDLEEGTNLNDTIDVSMLESKSFRYFEANGAMNIYIPLRGLYSGNYRIKLQILPTIVDIDNRWTDRDGNTLQPLVSFHARLLLPDGTQLGTTDENGKITAQTSPRTYVDQKEVKYYTLWDRINVPYSFASLPSGVTDSYPMLQIQIPTNYQREYNSLRGKTVHYGLCLTKVWIEPVE